MSRTALVERTTKESDVRVELDLDGTGQSTSDTGVPFFDHMVAQLGRHGGFDLTVRTRGDLEVDAHHTVEDTALAIGSALKQALGDKAGIRRFGDAEPPTGPILAVRVEDLSEKEAVLAAGVPGVFTIPHFDGYAAVLIELDAVDEDTLREAIVDGWLACAPPALGQAYVEQEPRRDR